ncbi:MAG: radical SAM protein [Prolixibacteraceae bacterium]|nr:radical SAM protein [Prolixibacteraceae bacterium]
MLEKKENSFSSKVLLIKPKYGFFPIGFAYVMASLDQNGIPFDFVDLNTQRINYRSLLNKHDYIAIATGGLVGDARFFLDLSKQVKHIRPDLPLIMGGNITQCLKPDILFNRLGIDFVVLGEAETAFPGLLRQLESGEGIFFNLPGIMYKDKNNGTIVRNSTVRLNLDLNDIEPAWHYIDMKRYLDNYHHGFPGQNFIPIMTGRGCTGHCSFCSPTLGKFRPRKIDNILREMWNVSSEYSFGFFGMLTEVLFATEEEIIEFCRRYKEEGPQKEWFCSLRLDVDPVVLSFMKESGCIGVSIGAESGSDVILKRMRKGIRREQIQIFIDEAKRQKMALECNIMVGSEGETEDDIKESFNLLIEKEVFSNINLTTAYPGTLIYKNARKKGLISDEFERTVNEKYLSLADMDVVESNYINISDIPSTSDLHLTIMREVRRYTNFLLKRFPCKIHMDFINNEPKLIAKCPACDADSEVGKMFGNWGWDGLVLRLVCPNCYEVSFSRVGASKFLEMINDQLKGAKRVVILGDKTNARSILAYGLGDFNIEQIIGFVSADNNKVLGRKFFSYPLYKFSEINAIRPDAVLVADVSFSSAKKNLMKSTYNGYNVIPLMPDFYPENILKNKRIIFIGADDALPYAIQAVIEVSGCEVSGVIKAKSFNDKGQNIDELPFSVFFSHDWDIGIHWCKAGYIDVFLWILKLNSKLCKKWIILERHKHPSLNAYLWMPAKPFSILKSVGDLLHVLEVKSRRVLRIFIDYVNGLKIYS